jgi:hypothetical protein
MDYDTGPENESSEGQGTSGPQLPPPAAPPGTEQMPPWEYPETMGYPRAFFETILCVLFSPSKTFRFMRPTGNLWPAFLYAAAINAAVVLLNLLIQNLIGISQTALLGSMMKAVGADRAFPAGHMPGPPFNPAMMQMMGLWLMPLTFILLMISVVVGLLIETAVVHVCLLVLNSAKRPFETTFRLVCYCDGSSTPLALVPCVGWIIASTWHFLCLMYGLSEQNRISTGKAALVLTLPSILLLLCCCCGAVLLYFAFA